MKLAATYHDSTLNIEGSADDLRDLAHKIEQCSGTCEVFLPENSVKKTVRPADTRIISISLGEGPVNISHSQDAISITGSKQKLDVLAENIVWLANQDEGLETSAITDHLHIEYHPGHFYLAETAIPVVLSRVHTEKGETARPKQLSVN